jgi:zinc transporter ZupT
MVSNSLIWKKVSNKQDNGTSKTSFVLLVGYVLSSIFAGLIFSCLALKAKSSGGSGIGWGLLSIICIVVFGYIGYAVYFTSSPTVDPFWYYFGITTIVANALAALILLLTILKRN